MDFRTSPEQMLQIIGAQTIKLELLENALKNATADLAVKTAECERLIEEDSKRLQEEMAARAAVVGGNGKAAATG